MRDEGLASATAATEPVGLLGPLRDYLSRNAVRWRHECAGFGWLAQGHDHTWWLNRLRELQGDPVAMGQLRTLLAGRTSVLSSTGDEQMLMQAALALERGELRVCGREEPRKVRGGPAAEAPTAVAPPAPAPPPRARPSAPPPQPETLSPGAAHGSIAESHREAARLGIALCEECQRAAAEGAT
ncbi:MAG: hypothetical protein FJW34_24635 [Acidobacteria bacterium]|nr:hypothetical protein [Acidobacteriota bacterium]